MDIHEAKKLKTVFRRFDFYSWVIDNNIMLESGHLFTFKGHEYLKAIYEDDHPNQCFQKSAQVGLSTRGILECFHQAIVYGNTSILYQPSATFVYEFSKTRIAPIIQANPFMSALISKDDVNNASARKIGDGTLFCKGLQTAMSVKSVPADMIVIDEIDEVKDNDILEQTKSRLLHSAYKIQRKYSTPTFPNYGINAEYNESDQRVWMVKCPGCGKWRDLVDDFLMVGADIEKLIPEDVPVCIDCGHVLDLTQGEYVAKFPEETDKRGYRISQLNTIYTDFKDFKKDFKTKNKAGRLKVFMNDRIGIPWLDSTDNILLTDVLACGRDYEKPDKRSGKWFLGIDSGHNFNVILGLQDGAGLPRVIDFFETTDIEKIHALFTEYNINSCVFDGNPEGHLVRQFCKKYQGRVYMHFYDYNLSAGEYKFYRPGQIKGKDRTVRSQDWTAHSNRSEIAQRITAMIKNQEIILPANHPKLREFAQQCCNFVKQEDVDTHGDRVYNWIKTGPDHYRHALHYFILAMQKKAPEPWFIG